MNEKSKVAMTYKYYHVKSDHLIFILIFIKALPLDPKNGIAIAFIPPPSSPFDFNEMILRAIFFK